MVCRFYVLYVYLFWERKVWIVFLIVRFGVIWFGYNGVFVSGLNLLICIKVDKCEIK